MTAGEVRFIRDFFSMSQRELAKALSVGPATVARWEASGDGAHSPVGLHEEVLQALRSVALEVGDDTAKKQRIRGHIVLGIGALIYYLLTGARNE
jgi:transcriptional regulator with XRE-family HTH domain